VVVLRFHRDTTPVTPPFWWIDSPQVPSLYASGPTITTARDRALDKLDDAGYTGVQVRYEITDT
jgi:hypothetical protein